MFTQVNSQTLEVVPVVGFDNYAGTYYEITRFLMYCYLEQSRLPKSPSSISEQIVLSYKAKTAPYFYA